MKVTYLRELKDHITSKISICYLLKLVYTTVIHLIVTEVPYPMIPRVVLRYLLMTGIIFVYEGGRGECGESSRRKNLNCEIMEKRFQKLISCEATDKFEMVLIYTEKTNHCISAKSKYLTSCQIFYYSNIIIRH